MRFLFELCEMMLLAIFSFYALAAMAKISHTKFDFFMMLIVVLLIFGRGLSKISIKEKGGEE